MREKQTDSWLHNYSDINKKERLQNSIGLINQLSHIMPVDNNPAKCMCVLVRERWDILNKGLHYMKVAFVCMQPAALTMFTIVSIF